MEASGGISCIALPLPYPSSSLFSRSLSAHFQRDSNGSNGVFHPIGLFSIQPSLSLSPSLRRVSSVELRDYHRGGRGNRRSMVAVYLSRSWLIIIIVVVDIMAFGSFFFFLIVDLFDNFDSSE